MEFTKEMPKYKKWKVVNTTFNLKWDEHYKAYISCGCMTEEQFDDLIAKGEVVIV